MNKYFGIGIGSILILAGLLYSYLRYQSDLSLTLGVFLALLGVGFIIKIIEKYK